MRMEHSGHKMSDEHAINKRISGSDRRSVKPGSSPELQKLPVEEIAAIADAAAITIRTSRYARMNVSVGILAVIGIAAALYLARGFFVPLLIGILLSYTLSPVVRWLKKCHLPPAIAAGLVLAVLVGSLSWMAFSLSDDAAAMLDKLPEAARKLRQHLNHVSVNGPAALRNMQEAAKELQGVANELQGGTDNTTTTGVPVVVVNPDTSTSWLRDYALAQSALLVSIAAQTPIILMITYFLLVSGTHFRRKLVELMGPSLARQKEAVEILDEIDVQIQRYLLSMLVTNSLVGIFTWMALAALGVEEAGVWGVIAGILHFIPYLGPAAVAFASSVAGFLQFGSLTHALIIGIATLVVAGLIGFIFMTWLQGRFARINTAVLFISLLFFGWLWGIWGLLLGAPLVAIAKAICDRVESLKPLGAMLGR